MKIAIMGASRGIGRGLAEALAEQGHELFLVARLTGKTEFPQAVNVREGIAPLLRLVIDETCAGDSGSYFVLAGRKEPSAAACDAGLAAELRRRTMALLETR